MGLNRRLTSVYYDTGLMFGSSGRRTMKKRESYSGSGGGEDVG